MANWFVSINGEQKGPYPTDQLRQLVSDGFIPRDAYVWREGMAQWLPLSQVRISDDATTGPAQPTPAAAYQQPAAAAYTGRAQAAYVAAGGDYVKPGYFSFSGRISRQTFWLNYVLLTMIVLVVLAVVGGVLGSSMASIDEEGMPHFNSIGYVMMAVGVVIYILIIVAGIAGQVKRLHDRGRSGWFVLLSFVPLANIWILIEVCFLKGTPGPNEFGPDPLG